MRVLFAVALALSFILTGCIASEQAASPPSPTNSAELDALRAENEQLRDDLLDARKRALNTRRGETIEVLSTDVYFESGSANLTSEGVQKLRSVANRLKREYANRTIRVEGYTDDKPIGNNLKERYPSNWELSAARAAAVVRHFQWTHDIEPERLEVVGYGPYQPVATNETADGRRQNRRVRVAVLPEAEQGTAARRPASDRR